MEYVRKRLTTGAYMASAMHGRDPKRNGPPLCFRHSVQMAWMRSTSAFVSGDRSRLGICSTIFMAHSLRRLAKPECISALTERALARAAASAGQSFAAGDLPFPYLRM